MKYAWNIYFSKLLKVTLAFDIIASTLVLALHDPLWVLTGLLYFTASLV